MRAITGTSVGLAVALIFSPPAGAENDRLGSKMLDELAACRGIVADAPRLACLDRTSASIIAARDAGDLLALDRQKVVDNKRRAFGLGNEASLPLGGTAIDKQIAVSQVESRIIDAKQSGYARYQIQLANSTVWETVEPLSFPPAIGSAIVLKRAPLGGYSAAIGKARRILVKRVR